MSKRTVRDWESQADVMPAVEKWASDWSYRGVGEDSDGTREFLRPWRYQTEWTAALHMGKRWSMGWHVSIRQTGTQVHLEAWITYGLAYRIMTLGLMPREMGVQGGGFRDRGGRSLARSPLNLLVAKLGQPPIR
jgi:hypothetical protein